MALLHRRTSAINREMPRCQQRPINLPSSSEPSPAPLQIGAHQQCGLGGGGGHAVRACDSDDLRLAIARPASEDSGHRHSLHRNVHQLIENAGRDLAHCPEETHVQIEGANLCQQ